MQIENVIQQRSNYCSNIQIIKKKNQVYRTVSPYTLHTFRVKSSISVYYGIYSRNREMVHTSPINVQLQIPHNRIGTAAMAQLVERLHRMP